MDQEKKMTVESRRKPSQDDAVDASAYWRITLKYAPKNPSLVV